MVSGIAISSAPALAGGGNVMPPTARPNGYSQTGAALATAYFNSSGFDGRNFAGEQALGLPFRSLFTSSENPSNTFHVGPGTMFYVPILHVDDSPPILGDFPDVTDQKAVGDYYFDEDQLGAEFIEIVVDGAITSLGRKYPVGAETPGLPFPSLGGNNYTVAAVFLTPLTKGTHTVTIRALLTGDAIKVFLPDGYGFSITYTVIVR
jgi:hypothetical protein